MKAPELLGSRVQVVARRSSRVTRAQGWRGDEAPMASSQGETAFRRVPAPTAVRFDRDRNERNDNGNSHALMLDVYCGCSRSIGASGTPVSSAPVATTNC